ncbi:hypothetical protein AWB85_21500 [Mycobacteroides immunogenum]|uniref:Antitoxin VapB36 n=1 Tax=Mycobacteroides immunogenum TaxID=83262 RepID=A0A179VE98_9MYCO|nr:type II toxin-antitoxin system VapB family antitoxin [Mycobacteroides immunogenum]OAT69341.1 hypothetical protein AWB85_21500 [Mycobacteroides immunogenum]
MALNIKDPAIDALAEDLAHHLGTSKTDAVRQALRARLDALTAPADIDTPDRLNQAMYVLQTEIWPYTRNADAQPDHPDHATSRGR